MPKGVRNVVKRREAGSNGICQKPLFVSIFEKTVAPESWAGVVSTLERGCTSLRTLWFNGLRSTYMRTLLFGLGTTTIAAHHGVSVCTFEITSICSILLSSAWTFSRNGKGIYVPWVAYNECWLGIHVFPLNDRDKVAIPTTSKGRWSDKASV